MKKNLLKILALGTVVLSLSACDLMKPSNKSSNASSSETSSSEVEQAVELTIAEVFSVDSATYKFEHEGKLVRVKNACCVGSYGNTLVAGVPYASGGTITDLKGFEVELEAQPQWTTKVNGQYADITVEGRLTDVNGRPVLKDASVVVNGEAHYDENGNREYPEGSSSYSCGYWSSSQFVRAYYDEYMGRSMNGALVEGIFQLASVPTTVTANAAQEFSVVFPGENTNGQDEDNEYLINVTIPAGLSEKAVNKANNFFADKQVGDFLVMDALTRYDSTKGGIGLLYENYWCGWLDEVAEEERPVILTSWAGIQEQYASRYQTPLPNIGCEQEGVFSYVISDYFATAIDKIGFSDASFILVDHENGGLMEFAFNCGSAKAEAVFAALGEKALAAGYEKDTTVELEDEEVEAIYVLKSAEDVVAELYFGLGDKSVTVFYIAIRNTFDFANTFAGAIELYEGKASVESALPDLPAADAAKVTKAKLDWSDEETFDGFLAYSITPTFAADSYADDAAWEAMADAYEEALLAAGFAKDYAFAPVIAEGFYNSTTKEFIAFELTEDADEHYNGIEFFVLVVADAEKAAGQLFDVSEEHAWTIAEASAYMVYTCNAVFGKGAPYKGNVADIYIGAYYDTAIQSLASYVYNYVVPSCAAFQGAGQTPNATEASVNDTYYVWYLKSATEGKVLQVALYFEAAIADGAAAGYSYMDILLSEVDAA